MSLFVVEPGNKLAPDSVAWAVWTEENFMIRNLICVFYFSLFVFSQSLKALLHRLVRTLPVWWMLITSFFPLPEIFSLLLLLFYKVQNDDLIKSVCLLKVKGFLVILSSLRWRLLQQHWRMKQPQENAI